MSDENPDNYITNKTLPKLQPLESASLDEWRHWALQLNERHVKILEIEKVRRKAIKKYKKDISGKDAALHFYKKRIAELEKEIEDFEEGSGYKLIKWLNSLLG